MDLRSVPVIDNHIHTFPAKRLRDSIHFSITSFPMEEKHLRSAMPYHMLIAMLRKLFAMEGASDDEVMAERNRRFDADPRGYIHFLMRDAGIKALICDLDAPISAYWTGRYRTEESVEEFFETMEPEVAVGRVIRIEIACNLLLDRALGFDDFCSTFRTNMLAGIEKYRALALKSVIGYFTGLAVSHPSYEEAEAAYAAFLADRSDAAAEKIWRDYMLHEGLAICVEKNLPLHIHTGWGDTPYGDLRRMDPFDLYDFLKEETCRKVPVVLLHAGYPYVREIGILASQLPQVYLDISEMVPYAGYAADTALPMILETAPITKVLYGTDGGGLPEPIWMGAVYIKRVLEKILDGWVREGWLSEAQALEAAENILWRNAESLYPNLYA